MHHLFSRSGQQALAALIKQHQALLAFDFDGTLAPIVARPDAAMVPGAVARRLAEISLRRPVAVISGRRAADVGPRLGFAPTYVLGNHGAEGLGWRGDASALDTLRERLHDDAATLVRAGVYVEDKGLSLALHYRLARDADEAQSVIHEALRQLPPGLQSFGGKRVVNVVLREAPDKADAVRALMQHSGCDAALFVGDDVNDESVFSRAGTNWLTVRIGRSTPPSQAMYCLDSHTEILALVDKLRLALASESVAH